MSREGLYKANSEFFERFCCLSFKTDGNEKAKTCTRGEIICGTKDFTGNFSCFLQKVTEYNKYTGFQSDSLLST